MDGLFKNTVSTNRLMIHQLQRLEDLSSKYKEELSFLSKKIRKDLWNKRSEELLLYVLKSILNLYEIVAHNGCFSLESIKEIVALLEKYFIFINPSIRPEYFQKLVDGISIVNAKVIIGKRWDNILLSDNGAMSFIEQFGDIFTKTINVRKDGFFHPLNDNDILCRAVPGTGYKTDRFIPWPNKTFNRWNPPGRTYLYLSYSNQIEDFDKKLTKSEYICLEEIRAKHGEQYSFCYFEPKNKGSILDLSYNDIELWEISEPLDEYGNSLADEVYNELISDPSLVQKYSLNRRKLRRDIKSKTHKKHDKKIIEDVVARRYLKFVCSAIYQKVDTDDEKEKEKAYRSFHILSNYLENQGVTGIIYPCTRTKAIAGKNIVLFNINDATPIEGSIKTITY